jgi:hypothetical protein
MQTDPLFLPCCHSIGSGFYRPRWLRGGWPAGLLRHERIVPERGTVRQTQSLDQVVAARLAVPDRTDQCRCLVGCLVALLAGRQGLTHGISQCAQYELDK